MFDTPLTVALLWATVGYMLGSIPFGIVITRAFGLGDLRKIGSGNIGATNVLRTGNKPAALATLLLDSGKGAIAVLLAMYFNGDNGVMQIAGLAAMLGHCFPVWLKFKGGKGVATFLGTLLALSWPLGLAACGTWLFAALVSRISSVGALSAAMAAPIWAFVMGRPDLMLPTTLLLFLITYRHKENLDRLKAGTEPKIGKGKKT